MLSLGLGLGFGSMEENELEEGEAFSCHAYDDDCIDPDIALSYIDEKLQNVLGHFLKDFEGGVSAENLGAKFGGYGSFLPAYQRSPTILFHPRSPPKPPNNTISKSPYNISVECAQQKPSVPRGTSISKINSSSIAQPGSLSGKENGVRSLSDGGCVPLLDSNNKQVNGSDQKSLKVRIRVGPDNTLARNNTAIYSGLGLDTSPFSSPEDSSDACPRPSPKIQDALSDSPSSILQVMTCFSVPGGYLLSPLNDNLFQLTETGNLFSRKTEMLNKGVLEMCVLPDINLPVREVKGFSEKKNKSDEVTGRLVEDVNLNSKGDATKMLKNEIVTPASKRIGSSELNMSLQSCSRGTEPKAERTEPKAERKIIDDSAKGSSKSTLECFKEHNQSSGKDRFSLPDFAKGDQVISKGNVKSGGYSTSGNGTTHSKGEPKSKTSLLEKEIEERNPNNHKETLSDTPKEVKSKNLKSYDIIKLSDVEYKSKNDQVAGHSELGKHVPGQRVVSQEKDAEKAIQINDKVHDGKLRQKWSHIECAPPAESIQSQENLRPSLPLVSKEKKKSSHARKSRSENTSEKLKSHKETSRGHSRESRRDVAGNTSTQIVDNRARLLEPLASTEKSTGKLGVKKEADLHPEPMENPPAASVMCTAPTLDAAAALGAPPPVVIEENWVCCDKCQKWRLLPYGADPHHLPKKWKCSMQVWLPGMNKCSISEDETTKAFNAMYLVPAPEADAKFNGHNGVAASGISPADAQHFDRRLDHDMQNVPITGKKSSGVTGSSKVSKNSLLKKSLQSSDKNRRILHVSEYPLETNSSIKGCVGLASKSTNITTEKHIHKQKEKHEIRGRYSDGGDFVEKSGKHSKPKRKREANQDGFRTSKKFKEEDSEYLVEDKHPNLDMADMAAPGIDSGLSAKASGKILQNYSEHSSSKDSKCEPRGNLFASITKSKDPVHIYSNGDFRDHIKDSNVEKSSMHDYAAKKRKVKEWQDSQVHLGTVTIPTHTLDGGLPTIEGELRKQKEAKIFKSQGKEYSMNNVDQKGRSTKILLPGNREQRLDGVGEDRRVGRKQHMGQYQETGAYRQALDDSDHVKRDTTHAQLPTTATSSSSKVSSSRKSKANLQEARGSPVESVSSSPLRTSTTEKAAIRRKTVAKNNIVNANSSSMGSQKRCSDGELGSDQSGTRRKETGSSVQLKSLECDRAGDSGLLGSMVGTYHYPEKEGSYLSGGNNKNEIHVKKGVQVDISHAQSGDTNAIGDAENIFDHHNKNLFEGTEEGNIDGDRNKVHDPCYGNGTGQRKSDECYSSFKEDKTSSSDANKVNKVKVDDSNSVINKKELHSSKKGSHFQSETDFKSNGTNYHVDLRDENCNFQDEGKESSSAKQSYFDRRDNLSSNGLEETLDAQNKETNSRVAFVGASCEPKLQEDLQEAPSYRSENPMSRPHLDGIDRTETVSGRGMSLPVKPSSDKSEARSSGSRSVHTPTKVSRSVAYPIVAENGHAIKMVKHLRNPDSQNGTNNLRQVIPNGRDSSPMRKDGPAAANVVLKEARDIKHKANRMKNEGLDHESIGLYFQSALKFLQGALLLELPTSENVRQGETNPSTHMMQMYSDTARLCEYCAHEYERCKEMAAAALAYKCVEVAYMKVAYYKHAGASKDRHELVTALQTGLPGESPSSSASDIDNLNNQCVLDKAVSAMAAGSPQIAGNHVISARNRPNFVRLLSYTNDLNCAFDATKRSQNAMAAATVSLEKDGVDGLSSVRKVLDFNFHNVEGLLRLVRLSLESISR